MPSESPINHSLGLDWLPNDVEDDHFFSQLIFDASENGLWNGRFVPPPPRPPFLDEAVSSDGLTSCDLCTWAWKNQNSAFSLNDTIAETTGAVGWPFILIAASILSALFGAILVIIFKCKRFKPSRLNEHYLPRWYQAHQQSSSPINIDSQNYMLEKSRNENLRVSSQEQQELNLSSPQHQHPSIQENHYTVIDDLRNNVELQPAQFFRNRSGGFITDGNGVKNSEDTSDLNVAILVVNVSKVWKSCI